MLFQKRLGFSGQCLDANRMRAGPSALTVLDVESSRCLSDISHSVCFLLLCSMCFFDCAPQVRRVTCCHSSSER